MLIMGASGLASSVYIVKRYEVRRTVTFPEDFLHVEGVWGRGVFTSGWSMANPNFGEGFCEVVPGTITETGVTLRTYVYQVSSINGSYLGYYPSTPANATFAYTVLGIPEPTLSGPDIICNSGSTYSIVNPPTNTTITWGGTNVSYPNGNTGTSVTVRAEYSSTSANGTVTASFTINGNLHTLSHAVRVNPPYPGNLSLSLYDTGGTPVPYMCPNTHYHIYLNNNDGCSLSDYTWSIPAGWTQNCTWSNMVSVYTGSTPGWDG